MFEMIERRKFNEHFRTVVRFRDSRQCTLLFAVACLVVVNLATPAMARDDWPDQNPEEELAAFIPNFSVVTPALWRGGLPQKGGMEQLKKAGVKSIIDLMLPGKSVNKERAVASKLNIKFFNMPMNELKKTNREHDDKFLSIVTSPDNQPVFVHCRRGQDRVGTMVAIYRVRAQGWTADQAYSEMLAHGFHRLFFNLSNSVYTEAAREGGLSSQLPPSRYSRIKSSLKRTLSIRHHFRAVRMQVANVVRFLCGRRRRSEQRLGYIEERFVQESLMDRNKLPARENSP